MCVHFLKWCVIQFPCVIASLKFSIFVHSTSECISINLCNLFCVCVFNHQQFVILDCVIQGFVKKIWTSQSFALFLVCQIRISTISIIGVGVFSTMLSFYFCRNEHVLFFFVNQKELLSCPKGSIDERKIYCEIKTNLWNKKNFWFCHFLFFIGYSHSHLKMYTFRKRFFYFCHKMLVVIKIVLSSIFIQTG